MKENIETICSWYKSPTISKGANMYFKCHKLCQGYETQCSQYSNSNGKIDLNEYYKRKGWFK